jgi:hypothetical protein
LHIFDGAEIARPNTRADRYTDRLELPGEQTFLPFFAEYAYSRERCALSGAV